MEQTLTRIARPPRGPRRQWMTVSLSAALLALVACGGGVSTAEHKMPPDAGAPGSTVWIATFNGL